MDKASIGKRIREQREKQNLLQEKFAEMVGISNVHLSEIERGKKGLSFDSFLRIVKTLDIPADFLLRDEISSSKPIILNDITEKMKDFTPEQLEFITDLFNAAIKNFAVMDKKKEVSE